MAYLGPFTVEFRQVTLCSNHIKNIQWVCLVMHLKKSSCKSMFLGTCTACTEIVRNPFTITVPKGKYISRFASRFLVLIKLHSQVISTNLYFLGWIDQMEQFFNINHCDLRFLRST